VISSYAGGLADIRTDRAMTAQTPMMAYSMSKTITAVAVLTLAADGRLELDAPLEDYVGHPYGAGVTIRRLLSHTAGLPNPIPLSWIHPESAHAGFDEGRALAEVLRRYSRTSSPPGTRYRYSNIGYWLLGPVVARVSGQGFEGYVGQHVFRPIGIGAELLDYTNPVSPVASGYLEKWSLLNLVRPFLIDRQYIDRYDGAWLRIRPHYLNGAAFGGLVGTAEGFGRFLTDQLQEHSAILDDRARRWLYERQTTMDGRPVPMTLGWHVGEVGGTPVWFKEGGGGGFHAMMRLYPARGVGSVIISNATAFDVAAALDTVDPLASH